MKIVKFWLLILSAAILTACGETEEQKDPPVEGLQLVERIFRSMEQRDFRVAAMQYRKLMDSKQELEPVALIMEQVIISNATVSAVQRIVDEGDIYEALLKARDAKRLYPLNQEIDIMLANLTYVNALQQAADGVRRAQNSIQLAPHLSELEDLINSNPAGMPLMRLHEVGTAKLAEMKTTEELRGRFDLLADLYAADFSADKLLFTIQAEYEYELKKSQKNPMPLEAVQHELYRRRN